MAANQSMQTENPSPMARPGPTAWLEWPLSLIPFGIVLAAIYWQGMSETVRLWFHKDEYSHCVFIFPLCAFILHLNRQAIKELQPSPSIMGFAVLAGGLLMQFVGHILRLGFLEMWSMIPVVAGGILLLHGWKMWRMTRFAVLYAFFAFPIPLPILGRLSMWIQHASTTGARMIMQSVGYTVVQTGNLIEIPGYTLEVAGVCSGFKKLTALIAFSIIYGYLFTIPTWKKIALVVAAVPIAVITNALRVAGLIAVTSMWGLKGLDTAHNWGEIVALGLAFCLFVLVGKALGCKTIRF